MASTVHVDHSSLFGPNEKEINEAFKQHELDGFESTTEQCVQDAPHDFLGISETQTDDENGKKTVK